MINLNLWIISPRYLSHVMLSDSSRQFSILKQQSCQHVGMPAIYLVTRAQRICRHISKSVFSIQNEGYWYVVERSFFAPSPVWWALSLQGDTTSCSFFLPLSLVDHDLSRKLPSCLHLDHGSSHLENSAASSADSSRSHLPQNSRLSQAARASI